MKKFLTVLLVIAVMFTFSFGSAFAASTINSTLADTYFKVAMEQAEAQNGFEMYGYTVDYATLQANEADLLAAAYDWYDNNGDVYVQTVGDLWNMVVADEDLLVQLFAYQYEADKAEAIAILNGLSVADYSTSELSSALKTALNADCTYQEYVEKLINDAINEINKATFTTDSTRNDYIVAKRVIDAYFDGAAIAAAGSTKLVVEKYYTGANNAAVGLGTYQLNTAYVVTGATTLAEFKAAYVAGEDAVTEATIASVKAAIASGYADYLRTDNADTAKAAKAKAMLDYLAEEEAYTSTNPDDAKNRIAAADAAKINAAVAQVAELEAAAAQLAAEVDSTGALVRDAEDVADIVTAGTVAAYNYALGRTTTAYDAATYVNAIEALHNSLDDEKLAYMKQMRETAVADFLADAAGTYYPVEIAALTGITDAYLAKVNAVTACSKVDDYDAQLRTDVNAVAIKGTIDAKSDSLKSVAQEYAEFLNKQITKTANKYYVEDNYAKLNAEINKLVGNSEARTTKEINALSEDILALVKALPTYAEVEAAEDAAADAVKALPSTVKMTDKATIDAAIAAVDAYKALTTKAYADAGKVSTAVTKYAYAFLNEKTAEVKAVSKTDKAAIEALIDAFEAFVDEYEDYTTTDLEAIFDGQVDKLEGYLEAIQAEAASAVRKAIAAIPVKANITAADEATVEAARALYDAYVADYTDYRDYDYIYTATVTTDGFVADDFDYAALAGAETLLGLNVEDDAYSVEALKITAKSSAKKGSITVKWTVKGDTSAVEAYEIWKSTKKNSGFKKAFTTEKQSYKNTKGLKKGTRYYYKVRAIAYTEDGAKVTSDWSNKAYRIAK